MFAWPYTLGCEQPVTQWARMRPASTTFVYKDTQCLAFALFFWGFMFGFKLGAVQHALTACSNLKIVLFLAKIRVLTRQPAELVIACGAFLVEKVRKTANFRSCETSFFSVRKPSSFRSENGSAGFQGSKSRQY